MMDCEGDENLRKQKIDLIKNDGKRKISQRSGFNTG
jgi:hypothetical protein